MESLVIVIAAILCLSIWIPGGALLTRLAYTVKEGWVVPLLIIGWPALAAAGLAFGYSFTIVLPWFLDLVRSSSSA